MAFYSARSDEVEGREDVKEEKKGKEEEEEEKEKKDDKDEEVEEDWDDGEEWEDDEDEYTVETFDGSFSIALPWRRIEASVILKPYT